MLHTTSVGRDNMAVCFSIVTRGQVYFPYYPCAHLVFGVYRHKALDHLSISLPKWQKEGARQGVEKGVGHPSKMHTSLSLWGSFSTSCASLSPPLKMLSSWTPSVYSISVIDFVLLVQSLGPAGIRQEPTRGPGGAAAFAVPRGRESKRANETQRN